MKKYLLIATVFFTLFLFVLSSLTNVVGYQAMQTTKQIVISERSNQRELLFQTIVDIVNNKEIQRIILKSQMSRGIFPTSEIPVITKNQIRQMYFIGLILSKVISKSRMQSMVGKYQFNNQEMQKEITTVIEKDVTINSEITQLQDSDCGCENEYVLQWNFPVLCLLLVPFLILSIAFYVMFGFGILGNIMGIIGGILHCSWY